MIRPIPVWGFPSLAFFLTGSEGWTMNPACKSTRGRQGSTTGLHQGATESQAPPGRVRTGDLRSRETQEAAEASGDPSQALSLGTEDLGRMSCVTKLRTLEAQT